MHPRRWRTLSILVALVVIASSCGGGDDDASSTSTPVATATTPPAAVTPTSAPGPTSAEFIAAGDAICGTTQEIFDGVELGSDVTREDITELVAEQVVPALREELGQLEALAAPADDAETVAAILAALQAGIDDIEADPLSLLTADPLGAAQTLAQDYGFEICGSPVLEEVPGDQVVAPSEFSAEQQAVADVIVEFYNAATTVDRGLELLQDADRLEADLTALMDSPGASALTTLVTDVAFPDDATCAEAELEPGCALVTHDLLLGGTVISADTVTYAVLQDGQWKVSTKSFCEVSARAGVPCSS